jgi:hypothetical protein
MALTNNLKTQVDLPVWEWMRFNPIGNTTATTALTTHPSGNHRYLYYYENTNNALWKYDTYSDTWFQLSNSNATAASIVAVKYSQAEGYRGQVISATSNTLQIPSLGNQKLNNYQIKIVSGKGAGQIRTITATSQEVIHDFGIATSATANAITDSTKRYKQNQWVGYSLRLTFGTGINQFRDVLYNTENALTIFDTNYEGRAFLSTPFSSAAPYATPAANTGFVIASQNITLDTPWTTVPDTSSKFIILSGGIWFLTGGTNFLWYYYDILSDRWVQKLSPASNTLLTGNLTTDAAIVATNDLVGYYSTGSYVTGTSQSIDTGSLTPDDWIGYTLRIIEGSGSGQERRIVSNTSGSYVLSSKWNTMPVSGSSVYGITAENGIFFNGAGNARMVKYFPNESLWVQSNKIDDGYVADFAFTNTSESKDSYNISSLSVTGTATGITGINPTPTNGGTGYLVGDILTVGGGGSNGRVYVESVSSTGAALSISLYSCGASYSIGTGIATTGGTGTGCTIAVTSLAFINPVTTTINNNLKLGDAFVIKGGYRPEHVFFTGSVIGLRAANQIEILATGSSSAQGRYSQASGLLVDTTKNWTPGAYSGKLLCLQTSGLTGTMTWRRIIGNTTNTISFLAGTTPGASTRYTISDLEAFGADTHFLLDSKLTYGYPTSTTTSSITDITKDWNYLSTTGSIFYNYKISLANNSGSYAENIIVGSTGNTLNIGRTIALGAGTNTIAYSDFQGSSSLWTGLGTGIFSIQGNGGCWNGTRFVVGGSGSANTLAWSNDGVTWNGLGLTVHGTACNSVVWNGVRHVSVGRGTNTVAWSYDGVTWTGMGTATPFPTTEGFGAAWNGTTWVIVGQGTNTLMYAPDDYLNFTGGVNRGTTGTSVFSQVGRGVCWAGTQFIAVGSGSNTFATSSNGVTWGGGGTSAFGTSGIGYGVTWNGNVAVMVGSGSAPIYYSTDSGSTWTAATTPQISIGYGVSWNGTNFVAVGSGSGGNLTAFSANGIAWTGSSSGSFTTAAYGALSSTPYNSVVPSIGVVPTVNTRYKIHDSYGSVTSGTTSTLVDANKRWRTNQWANKRVVITSGTGQIQEATIASNTANTLTFSAVITTSPDTTSTYTILGRTGTTSTGITAQWNWGSSTDKGDFIITHRGGGLHFWEVYDNKTNRWRPLDFIQGAREGLTTGTMYAYDGADRIYFQRDSTGRIVYYDLNLDIIIPIGTIPYGMSTAVLGNRMEIVQTADGLKYLYIMRHSSNEMWRTLIYY